MWCGWECRNSYDPYGTIESSGDGWRAGNEHFIIRESGLGENNATFGQPRLGVGWREQTAEHAGASG